MARALVSPIPAPASPSELAAFEHLLEEAASWIQPEVAGAVPFLEEVTAAGADIAEIVAVDADPPVALLAVAVIVLIFGAGLFIRALGSLFKVLPWPVNLAANALIHAGDTVIQYGIDVVEWMVKPFIQLAQALWHGLDKLLGLGLGSIAALAIAVYKHIHIIGPHQIAANDTGIAAAAARQVNAIIAVAPDYAFKAGEAAHNDVAKLINSIPKLVPATAAAAVGALATAVQANTQVIDECALPWCDSVQSAQEVENALRGLLAGLLGAALFCELVNNPSGAASAISGNAGRVLAGLGVACVAAEDLAGGAVMELAAYAVSNPAGAAAHLTSVICG